MKSKQRIFSFFGPFLFLIFPFYEAHSKAILLDKIAAIVNDKAITLSQLRRSQKILLAKKNIAPNLYARSDLSLSELADLFIRTVLISGHLTEIGFSLTDDQIESNIKQTEKRLQISRRQLLHFLKESGMAFDEYFELMRHAMEFDLFNKKVIFPLISISDQEVKNAFYKKFADEASLSLTFDLVNFSIPSSAIKKKDVKNMRSDLKEYQRTGVLPSELRFIKTRALGNISEEFLSKEFILAIKKTPQGDFSHPVLSDGHYHVFFVQSLNLEESDLYNQAKKGIYEEIYKKRSLQIMSSWVKRMETKHFIQKNL